MDRLLAARTLLVQLQDLKFKDVEKTDPDVLVTDYSWDGTESREMSRDDVDRLRSREGRPRIVLAYMSIGEAEDYRFYWKRAGGGKPPYVDRANARWAGNYLVRFWTEKWRDVIFSDRDSYLSRILSQGFDGVFLDTVDAAETRVEEGRAEATDSMADLIVRIAARARDARPGFLVVAQNPFAVIDMPRVQEALSGLVCEDHLFQGERWAPESVVASRLEVLDRFKAAGKVPMLIEYPRSPALRRGFFDLCRARGYLCYVGTRSLARVGEVRGGDARQ